MNPDVTPHGMPLDVSVSLELFLYNKQYLDCSQVSDISDIFMARISCTNNKLFRSIWDELLVAEI